MNNTMEWERGGQAPDGFTVYRLRGDCDLYTAPKFMREIMAALTGGLKRARFDCAALRYLDSTGVGAIIKILQAAKAAQAEIRFSGLSGAPRKVLQLCNVITLIKEDPTGKVAP